MLIIGDSLLDVECARHNGVRSLAVATGRTLAGDLEAAGADWVIADLLDAHRCAPLCFDAHSLIRLGGGAR